MSPGQLSAERPSYIEQLRAETRGVKYRPAKRKKPEASSPDPDAPRSLFTVFTGNRWMELGEREPEAKMLFGEFWHQGELCMLFADSNAGKSALAVQIGNNIALAKQTGPFACGAKPEKVLYIDFELTTTQFYQRYSHPNGDHEFPGNFLRAQFNPATDVPGNFYSYDDFLIAGLEHKIRQVKASVLIVDNITCLRGGTESASVALRLMNNLKSLKADHKLSILVLAHTPKRHNSARPLSADDLHGSKLLINFADSAFAIGRSTTDNSLCYLKQIKQRNTEQIYGEDKVCLCRIIKPGNFLHFKFEGYSPEQSHLRTDGRHGYNRSTIDREQLTKKAKELSSRGLSQRNITRELNISLGSVNKLLNLQEKG
jgi:archaellum biogenesis ATPase FlaH